MGLFDKKVNDFPSPYTVMAAVREGGTETKLSMLAMGLGNIVHKQAVKGALIRQSAWTDRGSMSIPLPRI